MQHFDGNSLTSGNALTSRPEAGNTHWRLQVPDSSVMLAEDSDIARLIPYLGLEKGSCEALLESQPLVLMLMVERLKGPRSEWAPYLEFLPESFTHLAFAWQVRQPAQVC